MWEKFQYKSKTQDSRANPFWWEATHVRCLQQIICDRISSSKPSTRSRTYFHCLRHWSKLVKIFFASASHSNNNTQQTGERPYKCTECGLTFAQGNALKCHKRIHVGIISLTSNQASHSTQPQQVKTILIYFYLFTYYICQYMPCSREKSHSNANFVSNVSLKTPY